MSGEFDLIKTYFTREYTRDDLDLSVGDDCAIVHSAYPIAITTDTMVENTHFLPSISAGDLAYKAVATNLSDLAAMGATPTWVSLALSLPKIEPEWLQAFSQSLFGILDEHNVALIGGDTTRGTLSVTLTAQGILTAVPLCRHQAKVGDLIYVSGTLGDSAAGLAMLLENKSAVNTAQDFLLQRHLRPTARVALGQALAQEKLSCCALDISDGLLADLGHILARSRKSAVINIEHLPLSPELIQEVGKDKAINYALSGGENYELCFTVAAENQHRITQLSQRLNLPLTAIGYITESTDEKITLRERSNPFSLPNLSGFDHFK